MQGIAYAGFYAGGLSAPIRAALVAALKAAQGAGKGLWPRDRTARFRATDQSSISPPQGVLVYPKIFRRLVDAIRWAGGGLEPTKDLADFLRANPKENDSLVVHTDSGELNLTLIDVIKQLNADIAISVDLNLVDFISK